MTTTLYTLNSNYLPTPFYDPHSKLCLLLGFTICILLIHPINSLAIGNDEFQDYRRNIIHIFFNVIGTNKKRADCYNGKLTKKDKDGLILESIDFAMSTKTGIFSDKKDISAEAQKKIPYLCNHLKNKQGLSKKQREKISNLIDLFNKRGNIIDKTQLESVIDRPAPPPYQAAI